MNETRDKYAKAKEAAQQAIRKIRDERKAKAEERAKDNSPFTDDEIEIAERAIDRRLSHGNSEKQ